MSNNYFAIERNGQCWDHVLPIEVGNERFKKFKDMTYNEMKSSEDLDYFVATTMESVNLFTDSEDEQTIVTLIDEDDVFIWSVIMGPGEDDTIKYLIVDWKKDGKSYRYET